MKRLLLISFLLVAVNLQAQQPPTACFTGDTVNQCMIDFTDLSLGSPTAWTWSFPGGTPGTSTAQHPTVTYNTPGTYNVSLTVTNAFGNDDEIKLMNATTCYLDTTTGTPCTLTTGLQNLVIVDEPISIYPNPSEGKFRVESLKFGVEEIQVYDLFGRLVLSTKKPQIDMSSYPAGIYMVRIGEAVRKLVIQ